MSTKAIAKVKPPIRPCNVDNFGEKAAERLEALRRAEFNSDPDIRRCRSCGELMASRHGEDICAICRRTSEVGL